MEGEGGGGGGGEYDMGNITVLVIHFVMSSCMRENALT